MKNKKGRKILSLIFILAILINSSGVAKADNSLPKEPTEITITPSNFVPRIGQEVTFQIDNFGFENIKTGIGMDYRIQVNSFENGKYNAQQLKKIEVPEITVEKYKDNNWINKGVKLSGRMMLNNSFVGIGVEDKIYKPNEEQNFIIKRENIQKELEKEKSNWNKINFFNIYFELLNDKGKPDYGEYINRLSHKGTVNFTYNILDELMVNPYITLQGKAEWYTNDLQLNGGVERHQKDYPINFLYLESSDISLTVLEPKESYEPGEKIKLKVEIKNTSKNLPNTRLVSGLDFGEKEIIKNPTMTVGKPDIIFELPEKLGNKSVLSKMINPNESLEFITEITLPLDFTDCLNSTGDKIILTPYLYTSNIYKDDDGQKSYMHYEEREYNKALELSIKKEVDAPKPTEPNKPARPVEIIKEITLVGGRDTLTERVKSQLMDFVQYRLSGKDRYETSVEVSREYDSSNIVLLASGEKYTDELTATVLANKLDAPIMLTRKDSIPAEVKAEINRLGATKVIIIGGNSSVSKKVEEELSSYTLKRIGGSDRYDTAILVGNQVRNLTDSKSEAILVDGTNFPDAIAMTSMAVEQDMPILLTKPSQLPENIEKAIKDWELTEVTIGGGSNSVSNKVEKEVKELTEVNRVAGSDRYETSVLIAEQVYGKTQHIVIASGEVFSDAIVGAPYAAKNGYPILLSRSNNLPEVVMNYILGNR
ncbi:cell wall-binding repeat-containing protein [Miniphocaeibacter halophilus]|uniref:Cell wall-binding repeat-containing protein n=1 Tax=Miniphocaeibacter halophilus TaxID=2931922 RepID=A0AC61MS94_9FIRM|nr:cell wall-binding repeat-containing protein [Miniphocaeibacter halophilus]QQK08482.1 cell wall-binding repeat-containing protein [Miniphocaeibacter halophilus]